MRIVLGSEVLELLLRLMGIEFGRSRLGLQDLAFRVFGVIHYWVGLAWLGLGSSFGWFIILEWEGKMLTLYYAFKVYFRIIDAFLPRMWHSEMHAVELVGNLRVGEKNKLWNWVCLAWCNTVFLLFAYKKYILEKSLNIMYSISCYAYVIVRSLVFNVCKFCWWLVAVWYSTSCD